MAERLDPAPQPIAVSDLSDLSQVRVVIFVNGRDVHVPLASLLKQVNARLTALESK